jgi:hypothetical protein
LNEIIARCVLAGNYRLASSNASDLFILLSERGRFKEALLTAEEKKNYTHQASLGPWSQLDDEVRILQAKSALGRYTEVLAAVEQHRPHMKSLPEQSGAEEISDPWSVREVMLDTGREAALRSKQWETALALNAEIIEYQLQRGATELVIAKSRFNDYGPLLRLGHHRQARTLLDYCRAVFDKEGVIDSLGLVYSALAELEDKEGRPASAVSFEETALRYKYHAGRPEYCAISHNNCSNYMVRAGVAPDAALAHVLAASVIRLQISSGNLPTNIRNLSLHTRPSVPPAFTQVCDIVEQVEGVRFREMFARLPKIAPDGDAAIQAVWELAKAEAERLKEEAKLRRQEVLRKFEPLLQGIAAVARGVAEGREKIEGLLPQLEEGGWHIGDAVRRIWAGEREAGTLTEGLDDQDAALVRRVLELLDATPG